jgi:hypothetical protein
MLSQVSSNVIEDFATKHRSYTNLAEAKHVIHI